MQENTSQEEIAILIPCYNEEMTILQVIKDFQTVMPDASIYVFDNNSSDKTGEIAKNAGVNVILSPKQGKGNVVRHMFDVVDADIYVMVDGDATYPAKFTPGLIQELKSTHAHMVVGTRLKEFGDDSFRKFHQFGNHLITKTIKVLFQTSIIDVLSGYRVFTREFVKSIPLSSSGFEIETELTLQAIAKKFLIKESPISYGERPEGSFSKLNTFQDGWIILKAILIILMDFKPFLFFSGLSILLAIFSLLIGAAPIVDFISNPNGFVSHIPRAVLAAAFGILSALCLCVGLILRAAVRYHNENFILWRKLFNRYRN